ncbi:MAG: M48 metallopeptidase family protein [Propionibacteriaceae bacterium]
MELPEDVVIRRSARRRRTLQARRDGDKIVVLVPAALPVREVERLVPRLVERVRARETGGRRREDEALERAAVRLAKDLAPDLDLLHRLTSVRWTTRQNRRWGSCTTTTGEIRLSSRMETFPGWVVDYVLFHELVHLVEANHSARFHELVRRFPNHDRAVGFLEGVSHGLPLAGASPEEDDGAAEDILVD